MIIDVHVHPIYFKPISAEAGEVDFRSQQFGVYKQSPYDMQEVLVEMDYGGIDKAVLLPLDLKTISGGFVVSNEQIYTLVQQYGERFFGFASVDPNRPDAMDVLEHAFGELKLAGLKLNPSKQRFFPSESFMRPIYEKCLEYNRPILFHAGMTWEPDAPARFSQPLEFEDVAIRYPDLRFCLAHFGWPWVKETAMLLLKYPNVYADTAMLYLDSPKTFFEQVFTQDMGAQWLDRSFNQQVMFGSNTPRFRAFKLKRGLEEVPMRLQTRQRVFGGNALRFLGLEQ